MEEKKREMNPASLANLIPAQPGEVRNPLGINRKPYSLEYQRVSQEPIPEKVRKLWNENFGEEVLKQGDTWARGNAYAQHLAAVKGSAHAAQEIREAVEGRATQRVEWAGGDGGATEHPTFVISFTDEPRNAPDKIAGESPLELGPADNGTTTTTE